jgi:hypothetical protein
MGTRETSDSFLNNSGEIRWFTQGIRRYRSGFYKDHYGELPRALGWPLASLVEAVNFCQHARHLVGNHLPVRVLVEKRTGAAVLKRQQVGLWPSTRARLLDGPI